MLRALIALSLFLLMSPANAQDQFQAVPQATEHITGLDIEEHFQYIEKLYTNQKPDMNAISAFIAQYPLEDFLLTNTVVTNRGSQEPETYTRNNLEFVADEQARDYDLIDTRIRHTITNIEYLEDKLSAKVSYTSLFQGQMKKDVVGKGLSILDFKSLSVCTDILKLVNGGIKGQKADCRTDIIYGEPRPAR